MNNFMLAMDVDVTKPVDGFVNKLLYGGQMLLIGMITVFIVLGIIWLALTAFKAVFAKAEKKSESAPAVAAMPVIENTAIKDGEVIAAIAAVLALAESESGGTKFRVVSFKKR